MPRRKIALKEGDLVVIEAWDHSSDDPEGWHPASKAREFKVATIFVCGWLVAESKDHIVIAQGKGESKHYTTFFSVIRGAIKNIVKVDYAPKA